MKQKFRFFGRFQSKAGTGAVLALAGLLALVVCLSACGTGNNPNGTNLNGADLFVPDEGKLPPAAERELISEADVLGNYQGSTLVTMDGKQYGPYPENITINKKVSGNLFFRSPKMVYEGMPVDIGYKFGKDQKLPDTGLILTPAADGKSFSFTGKKGIMMFYAKNDTKEWDVPSNTSINGFIYKKDGTVYISFSVTYDTAAMHETFPAMPADQHKTMSSSMKNGIKK